MTTKPASLSGKKNSKFRSKVTLHTVAEKAQVSLQTVSNAINHPSKLAEDTLARVKQAIDDLGYRPSFAAQALRASSSRTIALVLADSSADCYFERSYLGRSLDGMLAALDVEGFTPLFHSLKNWNLDGLRDLFDRGRIDGALVIGPAAPSSVLEEICSWEVPVAFSDRLVEGANCTYIDYKMAMEIAVNVLVQEGAKKLAYLGGRYTSEVGTSPRGRFEGYQAAVSKHNMVGVSSVAVLETGWSTDEGRAAFHKIREHLDELDAVVAASDDIATGFITEALSCGYDLKKQLRVIGFDDAPHAACIYPPLSTTRLPARELAERATELLLASLKSEELEPSACRLETTWIAR